MVALGDGALPEPDEMEDLPEETEETDERGVDCRDILGINGLTCIVAEEFH